jgi:hypothetical protein
MKRQMALTVAVLASSIFTSALVQPAPLEFKGVPLGATKEQMLEKFPALRCGEGDICSYFPAPSAICEMKPGTPRCDEFSFFGPARAMMYWITLQDGNVRRAVISFVPDDYDVLVVALRKEYGKPSSDTRSSVHNRMRASLDNRTVKWTESGGSISVLKRGINLPGKSPGGTSGTVIHWGTVVIMGRGYAEAKEKSATDKTRAPAKKQ